jgi:arginase family enzyme
MASGIHLDLDGAWGELDFMPRLDARAWGPKLRYVARPTEIETFYQQCVTSLPPFILYGSGDFHHLAGLFVRRFTQPLTVISFDNHPDWDIRPPRWSCGAWVSRALELPNVQAVQVWGCGNFELRFPSILFANHSGLKSRRLRLYPWKERQNASVQKRFSCISRDSWRETFAAMAQSLAARAVYVTVDLDCLRAEEAVTNWENGLFTAGDLEWAIRLLRSKCGVLGGDLCGAWSKQTYARDFQKLAGWWDHPRQIHHSGRPASSVNLPSLTAIWSALQS